MALKRAEAAAAASDSANFLWPVDITQGAQKIHSIAIPQNNTPHSQGFGRIKKSGRRENKSKKTGMKLKNCILPPHSDVGGKMWSELACELEEAQCTKLQLDPKEAMVSYRL